MRVNIGTKIVLQWYNFHFTFKSYHLTQFLLSFTDIVIISYNFLDKNGVMIYPIS